LWNPPSTFAQKICVYNVLLILTLRVAYGLVLEKCTCFYLFHLYKANKSTYWCMYTIIHHCKKLYFVYLFSVVRSQNNYFKPHFWTMRASVEIVRHAILFDKCVVFFFSKLRINLINACLLRIANPTILMN